MMKIISGIRLRQLDCGLIYHLGTISEISNINKAALEGKIRKRKKTRFRYEIWQQ